MTTPQQPPAQPPPESPAQQAAEAALAAAIGLQLLSAASAAAAMPVLMGYVNVARLPRQAVFAALQIAMAHPPGLTGAYGAATLTTERLNLQRRAQFVVLASRRIGADLVSVHSRGQSMGEALLTAVSRERRYYAQHLLAIWNRSEAGAQTDNAAMTWGNLLGWHAVRDRNTSAECLAANGKNFYADHMPLIGYPGAVHPHCRCQAGAPFPGARLVPSHGLPQGSKYRRAA